MLTLSLTHLQTVKEVLEEIVPERRALLAQLKKEHGSKTLGNVTVEQVSVKFRASPDPPPGGVPSARPADTD